MADEKPSLQEIAAMPFPASQQAMRKHYNPDWGKDAPEPSEVQRKFHVKGDWTIFGSMSEIIEADSEEEAREIAREMARDDVWSGDVELDIHSVKEIEE